MDDPSTCTETSEVWAQPGLVCGRDQFYTCQMVVRGSRGTPELSGMEMCEDRRGYSSEPLGTRGCF
jgi:hypothetical protein